MSASHTRRRVLGVDEELHAVLARVAGAAYEHGHVGHRTLAAVHPGREVAVGKPRDDARGVRALDGQHREVPCPVDDIDVEFGGLRLEPGEVLLVVGSVRDREERRLGEPVGEQVVENAAVLAAHHAVLGAALG